MTSLAVRLHSAVRQRATDEFARWASRYTESGAATRPNSPEGRDLFPRYLVQEAIEVAVERIDSDMLSTLSDTRERITTAVREAQSPATLNVAADAVAYRAMEDERAATLAFIAGISEDQLAHVRILPYRHVLSDSAGDDLWNMVTSMWAIGKTNYWYPLDGVERNDVVAFNARELFGMAETNFFQGALRHLAIHRVREFREFGLVLECDAELFEPMYGGEEGYWSSASLDWIVYASHENSLTVGGTMLSYIQRELPTWQDYVWTGVFE